MAIVLAIEDNQAMVSALQLARAIRQPGFRPPASGSAPPPPFMVKPTTVARAAVRNYHNTGAPAATAYLNGVLARELNHLHPSMAANARNTVAGLAHYIAADRADGRAVRALDETTVLTLSSGPVKVRYDVVLNDSDIAARIVFWDGPDFRPEDAPLIAAVYARGLYQLYPGMTATAVGVWQARRNRMVEVPIAAALAKLPQAESILAGL